MVTPDWTSSQASMRYIYDTSFYFLVIVLLLNIISGIIIDTFGGTNQNF